MYACMYVRTCMYAKVHVDTHMHVYVHVAFIHLHLCMSAWYIYHLTSAVKLQAPTNKNKVQ